jgi:hypothetical protein
VQEVQREDGLRARPLFREPRRAGPPVIRLWMVHLVFLLALSALALYGAARRVLAPVARLPKVREARA